MDKGDTNLRGLFFLLGFTNTIAGIGLKMGFECAMIAGGAVIMFLSLLSGSD